MDDIYALLLQAQDQLRKKNAHLQDKEIPYPHQKADVDFFLEKLELARSTEEEKKSQLDRLHAFHAKHAKESPAMLTRLQQAVIHNHNVFEVLMEAVRVCSLGQITNALFEVGGQYRRNM